MRSGGAERGHRGQPDYGYLAGALPRSQRIPLVTKHLRSRRFSAPPRRQFVAGGQVSVPGSEGVRLPCGAWGFCGSAYRQSSGLLVPEPPWRRT
jgi:hypothetical protein